MDVMVWVKLRNLDLEFGTWLPVWLLPFSAQRLDFRKSVRAHSSSATFFGALSRLEPGERRCCLACLVCCSRLPRFGLA